MSALVLERLRWFHLDQVLAIEDDLFGAEQWSPAMFWNELAHGHHYVAAIEDGAIVGYGGVAVVRPEAWINNIAVRRDRQRSGVGRALLDELLAHARAQGATHTLLEVAADNAAAQKLYARYGFEVVGVRRGYYQPSNTDALVMRRDDPPGGSWVGESTGGAKPWVGESTGGAKPWVGQSTGGAKGMGGMGHA